MMNWLSSVAASLDDVTSKTTGILFPVSSYHRTIHYSLVAAAGFTALATYLVQRKVPAPYGKLRHTKQETLWGPRIIPTVPGHAISDGPTGTFLFLYVFLKGAHYNYAANWTLAGLFMFHFFQRGFIHPFIMNYGDTHIRLGVWLGAIGPNLLFHTAIADWVANAVYPRNHLQKPLVIAGLVLYTVGFVINRVADWQQAQWKKQLKSRQDYAHPSGWLFSLVANPNYFGEFVEWTGYLLVAQAPICIMWSFFTAATWLTRSSFNLEFYRKKFSDNYPRVRRALIPFLF